MPEPRSALDVVREHAAADAPVQRRGEPDVRVFDRGEADVRQRHVHVLRVRGGTPLNATDQAALAHALLPENFAVPVRVDRVHHARLLTGQNDAPTVRQDAQNRRRGEIQVRAARLGAVGIVLDLTPRVPRVAGGELFGPQHLARPQIEGNHRVAGQRRRVGIIVTRGDVHPPAFRVQRGRRPDRGARRPPELYADGVLAGRRRRVGDGVSPPDFLAGEAVERQDLAAERAAFVGRFGAGQFFQRGGGHVQPVAQRLGRAGDRGEGMVVHAHFPDPFAGARVERVHVRAAVADIDYVALRVGARQRIHHHRRTHAALGLDRPVQAAGLGVDRINPPLERAHEHPPADHGRLRGPEIHGQAEYPFHLEPRHVLGTQAGRRRGLEARVEIIHAPAVPLRRALRHGELSGGIRTEAADGLVLVLEFLAGDPFGHGAPFGPRPHPALHPHLARVQRVQHQIRGQTRHDLAVRGARHLALVAPGAVLLVERFAVQSGLVCGVLGGQDRPDADSARGQCERHAERGQRRPTSPPTPAYDEHARSPLHLEIPYETIPRSGPPRHTRAIRHTCASRYPRPGFPLPRE